MWQVTLRLLLTSPLAWVTWLLLFYILMSRRKGLISLWEWIFRPQSAAQGLERSLPSSHYWLHSLLTHSAPYRAQKGVPHLRLPSLQHFFSEKNGYFGGKIVMLNSKLFRFLKVTLRLKSLRINRGLWVKGGTLTSLYSSNIKCSWNLKAPTFHKHRLLVEFFKYFEVRLFQHDQVFDTQISELFDGYALFPIGSSFAISFKLLLCTSSWKM